MVVTAGPGEPFVLTLSLTNNDAVPVRVTGVVTDPSLPFPAWQSVSYLKDTNGSMLGPDQGKPFEPFELQPGESAQLNLTAKADSCAAGNVHRDRTEEVGISVEASVKVAYEMLGLPGVATILVPTTMYEPTTLNCIPTVGA